MIPFWKKTGKHSKSQSAQKRTWIWIMIKLPARKAEHKARCAPDRPAVHPHAADV